MWEENRQRRRDLWSTRKKDVAPRGVYRHRSGMWAIRFTCGAGHIHKEQVGRVKSEAIDGRNERRAWQIRSGDDAVGDLRRIGRFSVQGSIQHRTFPDPSCSGRL